MTLVKPSGTPGPDLVVNMALKNKCDQEDSMVLNSLSRVWNWEPRITPDLSDDRTFSGSEGISH